MNCVSKGNRRPSNHWVSASNAPEDASDSELMEPCEEVSRQWDSKLVVCHKNG